MNALEVIKNIELSRKALEKLIDQTDKNDIYVHGLLGPIKAELRQMYDVLKQLENK